MKNLLLLLLFIAVSVCGQTPTPTRNIAGFGAGFTSNDMAHSSILECRSTTKGFLPPKMTTTQRNAISSPASGLQIFNTTTSKVDIYNGTSWIELGNASVTSVNTLTGNVILDAQSVFDQDNHLTDRSILLRNTVDSNLSVDLSSYDMRFSDSDTPSFNDISANGFTIDAALPSFRISNDSSGGTGSFEYSLAGTAISFPDLDYQFTNDNLTTSDNFGNNTIVKPDEVRVSFNDTGTIGYTDMLYYGFIHQDSTFNTTITFENPTAHHIVTIPDATGTFVLDSSLTGYVQTSRTISTTSPLSGGGDLSANRTLSIANAAADGSTKGAASFTANDFDASSGNISIDYTNGQSADATHKGFLTSTKYTDFDNKVSSNTVITGATKTKITYDAKGLVTTGADATTADIADSTNKRYQTDNQNSRNDATSSIQTQLNGKEPTITAGTTADYWRGDKTWQPFPAIPGSATDVGALSIDGGNASSDVNITSFGYKIDNAIFKNDYITTGRVGTYELTGDGVIADCDFNGNGIGDKIYSYCGFDNLQYNETYGDFKIKGGAYNGLGILYADFNNGNIAIGDNDGVGNSTKIEVRDSANKILITAQDLNWNGSRLATTADLPIKIFYTATGTATTTFTVTIPTTMANTNYVVSVEAQNLLSSPAHWITNQTINSFDVNVATGLTGGVAFECTVTP